MAEDAAESGERKRPHLVLILPLFILIFSKTINAGLISTVAAATKNKKVSELWRWTKRWGDGGVNTGLQLGPKVVSPYNVARHALGLIIRFAVDATVNRHL
jgi:hypothetical protein